MNRINLPWLWVLGVALAVLSCVVHAQAVARNERVLTITPVTKCEDGSTALTQCPFVGYKIEHATDCKAIVWEFTATVPKDQLTYTATNLAPGTHCWRVRAYTSDYTTTAGAINTGVQTIAGLRPGAPGGITASTP